MKKIINDVIIIISILLLLTYNWARITYDAFKIEQIIFNMKVQQMGLEVNIIKSYILYAIIPLLIFIIVYELLYYNKFNKFILEIKLFNKIFNINLFNISIIIENLILSALIIFAFSSSFTLYKIGIVEYLKNTNVDSLFIEQNYVKPKNIKFNKKKNLIHIYVESFENTYLSKDLGGVEDVNLIPGMSNLLKEGISFSNNEKHGGMLETYGATWTVGALVAQTSGLPLNLPIDANSYSAENAKFLEGAVSLGEILETNGYSNNIIFGSDATYAGRKNYFEQHGNYHITDWISLKEEGKLDKDYKEWWGFEDSKLFNFAKEEILEISQNNKPFNYTILTANTHFSDGYTEKTCTLDNNRKYASSISCSDKMIYDFVNWIKKQNFYKDTIIVITGDHLSMDKKHFEKVDKNYTRTVFNTFLNTNIKNVNNKNRLVSSFDVFPTTLSLLGATWEGDRLGLGTNLFSGSKTIFEEYGYNYVNNELKKKSLFYNKEILGY